jgi:hypothetical protein
VKYRVWFTVRPAHEAVTVQERAVQRSTFVLYEGPDGRHAKRLARNLASATSPNVTPHVVIAESGWEVID